jgi:hypothetical protein
MSAPVEPVTPVVAALHEALGERSSGRIASLMSAAWMAVAPESTLMWATTRRRRPGGRSRIEAVRQTSSEVDDPLRMEQQEVGSVVLALASRRRPDRELVDRTVSTYDHSHGRGGCRLDSDAAQRRPHCGVAGSAEVGPLVVSTRALVAPSGKTSITPYPAFVPTKRRSPRKEAHLARSAHRRTTMANTSEPRSWPMSVA